MRRKRRANVRPWKQNHLCCHAKTEKGSLMLKAEAGWVVEVHDISGKTYLPVEFWCAINHATQAGVQVAVVPVALIDGRLQPVAGKVSRPDPT
jgi:hypothetical protein